MNCMPLSFLLSSKIQMSVGVCLWVGVCGCLCKCSGVRVLDSVFTGWRDRLISRKICLTSRFYGMDLHISWIMERRLFPDTRKKLNEFTDSQMKKRQFSGSPPPLTYTGSNKKRLYCGIWDFHKIWAGKRDRNLKQEWDCSVF